MVVYTILHGTPQVIWNNWRREVFYDMAIPFISTDVNFIGQYTIDAATAKWTAAGGGIAVGVEMVDDVDDAVPGIIHLIDNIYSLGSRCHNFQLFVRR